MKKEFIQIHNGQSALYRQSVFSELYLHIFETEITNIIYDTVLERDLLIKLLTGSSRLSHGSFYYREQLVYKDKQLTDLRRIYFLIDNASNLIENLSIADNLFFSYYNKFYIPKSQGDFLVKELFQKFKIQILPQKAVSRLSNFEKIQLELLMAYIQKKNFIIISDLSIMLSVDEIKRIFPLVKTLKSYGYTIVLLDTYVNFIYSISDSYILIKSGKTISTSNSELESDTILAITANHGKPVHQLVTLLYDTDAAGKHCILELENIDTKLLHNINFKIYPGEIVNIFCVDQNLASHFFHLLFESALVESGAVRYCGNSLCMNDYTEAQRQGIGYIPSNPLENSLFYNMTLSDNLYYPLSGRVGKILYSTQYQNSVKNLFHDILPPSLYEIPIRELDPIVLMTAVYCKWYLFNPTLLICINPFPNLNLELNGITQNMILYLQKRGISILIISSNWPNHVTLSCTTRYLKSGRLE